MPGARFNVFKQQDQGVAVPGRHSHRPLAAGARVLYRFDAGPWAWNWFHAHRSDDQPGAVSGTVAAKRSLRDAAAWGWGVVYCAIDCQKQPDVWCRFFCGGVALVEFSSHDACGPDTVATAISPPPSLV